MTTLKGSPNHRPGSFLELFSVAVPLMISSGSQSLMNMADRILLAGYEASAGSSVTNIDRIAAVTPAAMMYWAMACVAVGMILYANTFVSQFDGADKPHRLAAALWQAIWLAVVCGVLLLPLLLVSRQIFELVGHAPDVVDQEVEYFNTLCAGGSAMLISLALSCYFSGRRQTRVVMVVSLCSVAVNFSLDYLLISGRYGFPEYGMKGAALATVLARVIEILIYGVLIARDSNSSGFMKHWRPEKDLLKKYVQYGLPSGLNYFMDNSGFLAFLLIVGSLNTQSMAATNLAFGINSLVFIPLLGFGTAVQTIVGHHIGSGRRDLAARSTANAVRLGTAWTGAAAAFLILLPNVTLQVFLLATNQDSDSRESMEAILPVASQLLIFVAVYSVFDALAVVYSSALRGAGDTMFPMILTMLSSWFVMTIPAWLLAQQNWVSVWHLWLTCTAHIAVMGSLMWVRFRSGRWKKLDVIAE